MPEKIYFCYDNFGINTYMVWFVDMVQPERKNILFPVQKRDIKKKNRKIRFFLND